MSKVVLCVEAALGEKLDDVHADKIACELEPEQTNLFLQACVLDTCSPIRCPGLRTLSPDLSLTSSLSITSFS